MNRDDAIRRIRKCMSLAKSANEAESAAALRQAQALMREHDLDSRGVALASVREHDVKACFKPILHWEALLAGLVADAFACEVISTTKHSLLWSRRFERPSERYWRLVGVDMAPEIAGYAFEVLGRQCTKARRAYIARQSKNCKASTKAARGDAFAGGWVRGVEKLVERFAGSPKNAELLDAYMRKTYPELGQARVQRRDKGRAAIDHAVQGREAAKDAQLHHGMGGPLERRLIGGPA